MDLELPALLYTKGLFSDSAYTNYDYCCIHALLLFSLVQKVLKQHVLWKQQKRRLGRDHEHFHKLLLF